MKDLRRASIEDEIQPDCNLNENVKQYHHICLLGKTVICVERTETYIYFLKKKMVVLNSLPSTKWLYPANVGKFLFKIFLEKFSK
jgi:hypothetical protein